MSASIKDWKPSGNSNLKPEVKEAWINVLRNGNKKQIDGSLRALRPDGRIGYCCLGILCNLGEKASETWAEESQGFWSYGPGHSEFPPDHVLKKSGLSLEDATYLAEMNDSNIGFKRIARWIANHL